MKKEELVSIIRKIVAEEVARELPNVLVEILASKVGERELVAESYTEPAPRPIRKAVTTARVPKQFSTNPILNQILNETQGGVPGDPEAELVSGEMPTPGAQVSILDKMRTIPQSQLDENREVAGVFNVLKKDFRQVVKAMDRSAPRGPTPNFKMQPGMFDDAK